MVATRVATAAIAVAAGTGLVVAALVSQRRRRRRLAPPTLDDDAWMSLNHDHRLNRRLKPSQSDFRVTAVIVYTTDGSDDLQYVVGHNDEACNLLNSVCAERAGFLQLADLGASDASLRVQCVYISTDHAGPVTPGALCREYMCSSPWTTDDMRVVMEGTVGKPSRLELTLRELFPFASVYTRRNRKGQQAAGERIGARLAAARKPPPAQQRRQQQQHEEAALRGAVSACTRDGRAELHPLSFGACVVFADGTSSTAWQKKALEYGCSLDAVCQLCQAIEVKRETDGQRPAVVCMADQFGVAHAPFAAARSYLVEHGCEDVAVVLHDDEGVLHNVRAEVLLPGVPDMFTK